MVFFGLKKGLSSAATEVSFLIKIYFQTYWLCDCFKYESQINKKEYRNGI